MSRLSEGLIVSMVVLVALNRGVNSELTLANPHAECISVVSDHIHHIQLNMEKICNDNRWNMRKIVQPVIDSLSQVLAEIKYVNPELLMMSMDPTEVVDKCTYHINEASTWREVMKQEALRRNLISDQS